MAPGDETSYEISKKRSELGNPTLHCVALILNLQLKKFTIGSDWVPKKLDVAVAMPDKIDLSAIRGMGIQPGSFRQKKKYLFTWFSHLQRRESRKQDLWGGNINLDRRTDKPLMESLYCD